MMTVHLDLKSGLISSQKQVGQGYTRILDEWWMVDVIDIIKCVDNPIVE